MVSTAEQGLADAKGQLLPHIEKLIAYLDTIEDRGAASFFEEIAAAVRLAENYTDLMGPFMMLSTTAFRGFSFDITAEALVDDVLAVAQTMSATLAADDNVRH
jgi:hypothetical protein